MDIKNGLHTREPFFFCKIFWKTAPPQYKPPFSKKIPQISSINNVFLLTLNKKIFIFIKICNKTRFLGSYFCKVAFSEAPPPV